MYTTLIFLKHYHCSVKNDVIIRIEKSTWQNQNVPNFKVQIIQISLNLTTKHIPP